MPTLAVTKIIVLQSLPQGNMSTGRRLIEDIEPANLYYMRNIAIEFANVATKIEFVDYLRTLANGVTSDSGMVLHIECHGADDQTGLILADDSFVSWDELKSAITPINVATKCKLILVLAACYGAHSFGTLLTERLVEGGRAPCFALLGPTDAVFPDELLSTFTAFYKELLAQISSDNPLSTLLASQLLTGSFFFSSAEMCFNEAQRLYRANHHTPEVLEERARKMAVEARAKIMAGAPTADEFKLGLIAQEGPFFKRIHRQYFMLDLYPENASRFLLK